MSLDWEKAIYVAFIILAIVTRFWALGDRVMSHDESLHTQFSYQYYDGQGYQHTPLMHGPFLFHATAATYWLFGDNDFTSRIPVAILGIILVVMPYFLRPWLGRVGALFTSFIFLISPYISYYSRYIRHDIYVITWAMISFIAIMYYLRNREEKYLWWLAAGIALMFSTKEVAFIYVAIFGSALVIRLLVQMLPSTWFRKALPRLRTPILLLILGVILIGGGIVGQSVLHREQETAAAQIATDEGFAANPETDATAATETADLSRTEVVVRWTEIVGIGILSIALFLAARELRPQLESLPEFDLIVIFTTLVLPLASPVLIAMAGWNPRDYTLNTCVLEGQENFSALQVFLGRVINPVCWESFLQSGVVRSGFFLILALVVSVLIGLWWNRRRWLIAAVIFHGIFLVLYTSLFTNPSGWTTGMVGSLGYWLEQQGVQRGSQPWFYYLFVTPFYEFLPLIFSLLAIRLWAQKERINGIIGYWITVLLVALLTFSFTNWLYNINLDPALQAEATVVPGLVAGGLIVAAAVVFWFFVRRRQLMDQYEVGSVMALVEPKALLGFVPFVIWWMLLTWVGYSYAGEKMPWLSTHFVIPMGLLTGWYFNEKLAGFSAETLFSRRALLFLGLSLVLLLSLAFVLAPVLLGELQFGSQEIGDLTAVGQFLGGIVAVAVVFYFWRQLSDGMSGRLRNVLGVLAIFILLSLLTIRFMVMANFRNADYTTEFMVYAHGAPATKSVVMDQLEELSMRLHGDKSIRVAFGGEGVPWPFTWYLREYPNRHYFATTPDQSLNDYPVIIAGSSHWSEVERFLGNNYEQTTNTYLWWPMEEYRKFSWNALLGDPRVPDAERRGIGDPDVRQALWDIFFYRDYEKYGEVFGGTYTAGEWPLRSDLRMYVRKDVLPMLWDYGIGAVSAGGLEDPYAEGELEIAPVTVFNPTGVAGSGLGELSAPRNVALGPDGRVYVADSGNNRIEVFEADGTPVTTWGTFGAEPGQFNEPWGIAVDDAYVYVADTWNHRIQKFTLEGELVDVFGASGSPAEGDPALGFFFGPRSIVLLDDNRLLVTDTGNHRMQLLTRDGEFLQPLGDFGNLLGQMNEPVGISQGPDGLIYLADTWNGRVQVFNSELFAVNEWPVEAWSSTTINNKPYTAVDSAGRVYVTDPEAYRVLVFAPDGTYLARFGSFGTDANSLGLPNGIAIDAGDNVYIADAGNNRVLKFAPLFGPPVPLEGGDLAPDAGAGDEGAADVPASELEQEGMATEEDVPTEAPLEE